jgi:hypothetical protein
MIISKHRQPSCSFIFLEWLAAVCLILLWSAAFEIKDIVLDLNVQDPQKPSWWEYHYIRTSLLSESNRPGFTRGLCAISYRSTRCQLPLWAHSVWNGSAVDNPSLVRVCQSVSDSEVSSGWHHCSGDPKLLPAKPVDIRLRPRVMRLQIIEPVTHPEIILVSQKSHWFGLDECEEEVAAVGVREEPACHIGDRLLDAFSCEARLLCDFQTDEHKQVQHLLVNYLGSRDQIIYRHMIQLILRAALCLVVYVLVQNLFSGIDVDSCCLCEQDVGFFGRICRWFGTVTVEDTDDLGPRTDAHGSRVIPDNPSAQDDDSVDRSGSSNPPSLGTCGETSASKVTEAIEPTRPDISTGAAAKRRHSRKQ